MRYNDLARCKLVLLFAILFGMLAIEIFAWAQPKPAIEKYERKSVSYIDQILFTSPELRMSEEREDQLIEAIRKQVEMPRFDYNQLPDSLLEEFVTRWHSFFNQTEVEEEAVLQCAADILTETVAPYLLKILGDPEIQEFRARQMVEEVERERFIVKKAKEKGITAEDLEKVINSAYLYMIAVTDYQRMLTEDEETKERTVNYRISGGVVWFKLEVDKESRVKMIQMIETSSSGSADPDKEYAATTFGKATAILDVSIGEKIDGDGYAFRQTIDTFSKNIGLKVAEMDEFKLKTGLVDVAGSKISFPMGEAEGLYIDQKFLVYEKQKRGEEIIEKKKGFFYVRKIGDNTPDERGFRKDELSYGKMVIGDAEIGMDVREYPQTNIDLSIRFKMAGVDINSGFLSYDGCRLDVNQDVSSNIATLSGVFQYNTARYLRIPQLFATVGADIGIASVENITVQPYYVWSSKEVDFATYMNFRFGLLKKFYIKRVALYLEPAVGLQIFDISVQDDEENKTSFSNTSKAFSLNFGAEFALRENVNIGFLTSFRSPIGDGDIWSGYYKPDDEDDGDKIELFSDLIGPKVAYLNPFFGVYVNYSLSTFWSFLPKLSEEIVESFRKD